MVFRATDVISQTYRMHCCVRQSFARHWDALTTASPSVTENATIYSWNGSAEIIQVIDPLYAWQVVCCLYEWESLRCFTVRTPHVLIIMPDSVCWKVLYAQRYQFSSYGIYFISFTLKLE